MIQIPGQDIWFRADQLLSLQIFQEDSGWELLIICAYSDKPLYLQYETRREAQTIAQAIVSVVASHAK